MHSNAKYTSRVRTQRRAVKSKRRKEKRKAHTLEEETGKKIAAHDANSPPVVLHKILFLD
jgi:hypothetical protein